MIELPNPGQRWDYENGFYLTCDSTRIGKFLAHYELFKRTLPLPGAIVECGVFKGASFTRFAMMRKLFSGSVAKKLIGFDSFGDFPETSFAADQPLRQGLIDAAGNQSIGASQLREVLARADVGENVELVEGDICETLPAYVKANPGLQISLLNLDVDIYEPSKVILTELYPRIVPGGILILDDYGVFPGETAAADDYFRDLGVKIEQFDFSATPRYVVKR